MMETIPAIKYNVCMLAPDDKYQDIEESLSLFIGPCSVEKDVHPFMLRHRRFDIYVLDLSTTPVLGMSYQFDKLMPMIRTHRSSVFCFWDKDTWTAMVHFVPDIVRPINVVYCDTPDWWLGSHSCGSTYRGCR